MVSLADTANVDSYEVKRNSDGTVSIFVNYNADIHNQNITVQLDPSRSNKLALAKVSPMTRNFQAIPNDNEMALFYGKSVYDLANVTLIIANVVAGLSLLVFILGIFAGKLVGVEMMAVIQISYLSLLGLPILNPCFSALTNIWFVNGFNFFSLSRKHLLDKFTPTQIKGMLLYSRFVENYNFTFALTFVPYLIGLVLFILSRTYHRHNNGKKQRMVKMAKKSVCEYAFNGVMFSGYIVSVSLAL